MLALPMWHAYALGWVHASIEVGCPIHPLPPTALSMCAEVIRAGATVVPLVPATAKLLAARAARCREEHRIQLAIVGAGAVDADLDDAFHRGFGIRLARNYGSTETGALCSGAAGISPMCVGEPLEGVEVRLLDPAGEAVDRVRPARWSFA